MADEEQYCDEETLSITMTMTGEEKYEGREIMEGGKGKEGMSANQRDDVL